MITIPADWVTYINLGVLAFYILMMVIGAGKGFLRQIVALTGNMIALFVSWRYHDIAASYLRFWPRSWTPLQETLLRDQVYAIANQAMWFVIIFVVCRLLLMLIDNLFREIESTPVIREISGLLGGALGAVNATLWILIFSILLNTPVFANGKKTAESTAVGFITDKVTQTVTAAGFSLNTADMINTIYEEAKKLDDKDREAVQQWLEDQGFRDLSSERNEG